MLLNKKASRHWSGLHHTDWTGGFGVVIITPDLGLILKLMRI